MCMRAGGEGWDTTVWAFWTAGGEVDCLSIFTLKAWRVGRFTVCTIAYWGGLGASLGGCLELVFVGEGLV